MTDVPRNRGQTQNGTDDELVSRCELCGAAKVSPDGIAETKADHFVKCPRCGQWFDKDRR
jgi:transcription elongation factor Elf1